MDWQKKRELRKALERAKRQVAKERAQADRERASRGTTRFILLLLFVLSTALYFDTGRRPEGEFLTDPLVRLELARFACNVVFCWVWILQPVQKRGKRKPGGVYLVVIACTLAYGFGRYLYLGSGNPLGLVIQTASMVCYAGFLAYLWKYG